MQIRSLYYYGSTTLIGLILNAVYTILASLSIIVNLMESINLQLRATCIYNDSCVTVHYFILKF